MKTTKTDPTRGFYLQWNLQRKLVLHFLCESCRFNTVFHGHELTQTFKVYCCGEHRSFTPTEHPDWYRKQRAELGEPMISIL